MIEEAPQTLSVEVQEALRVWPAGMLRLSTRTTSYGKHLRDPARTYVYLHVLSTTSETSERIPLAHETSLRPHVSNTESAQDSCPQSTDSNRGNKCAVRGNLVPLTFIVSSFGRLAQFLRDVCDIFAPSLRDHSPLCRPPFYWLVTVLARLGEKCVVPRSPPQSPDHPVLRHATPTRARPLFTSPSLPSPRLAARAG